MLDSNLAQKLSCESRQHFKKSIYDPTETVPVKRFLLISRCLLVTRAILETSPLIKFCFISYRDMQRQCASLLIENTK
jgi:hypothetical protein